MAIDPGKRQKQLARKAARRKQELKKRKPTPLQPLKNAFLFIKGTRAPIYECLLPKNIFELGMGNILLSRKAGSQVFFSAFLLDVFCLGIKDATYSVASYTEYCRAREHMYSKMPCETIHPTCARKLVEGAEAYARALGFSPHLDYRVAKEIFGDVDAGACPTVFEFGKDGRPFFINGPYNTPRRCQEIIQTLRASCGEDGFHYLFMGDDSSD